MIASSLVDVVPRLEAEMVVLSRRARRKAHERAALIDPTIGPLGYGVVEHLRVHGPARASDLAVVLCADKGAMSRLVQTLLDAGLAERTPDPEDGRAFQIGLTDLARERIAAMIESRRASFVARFEDWDPGELERFVDLLTRYNATLED